LANCALQPLAGKLYTYFNSKWIFLSFLGIFELGSLLCGVAVSSKMLILGRAVAGMGGAGLMNGALTIMSASVPLVRRPRKSTQITLTHMTTRLIAH
jgi:MFS family permease